MQTLAGVCLVSFGVSACASHANSSGPSPGNGGTGANAGTGASGGPHLIVDSGGTGGAVATCTPGLSSADNDGDGFSPDQGDCDDCNSSLNPGAYDFPNNGIDEDCNGKADDSVATCDSGLAPDSGDPLDAAKALGLCQLAKGNSWGVVSAQWVFPDGTSASVHPTPIFTPLPGDACESVGTPPNPLSHGILPAFGTNVKPLEGASVVALSTGVARPGSNTPPAPSFGPSPMDGARMCRAAASPPQFPKDSPSCAGSKTADDHLAYDSIALELVIKAPSNARALSFNLDFYSAEWPTFVCGPYNDFFVALLQSQHPSVPADQNIAFDSKQNPISVNNGYMEVCDPALSAAKPALARFTCARGTTELLGTGFETAKYGGATGWLKTSSPIVPGETIHVRFAIWDMGDERFDSTVLLDQFSWDPKAPDGPTTERPPDVR